MKLLLTLLGLVCVAAAVWWYVVTSFGVITINFIWQAILAVCGILILFFVRRK